MILIASKDYQNFPEKIEGLWNKTFFARWQTFFSKLQGTNKLVMTAQYENAECKIWYQTHSITFKGFFSYVFNKIIKGAYKTLKSGIYYNKIT